LLSPKIEGQPRQSQPSAQQATGLSYGGNSRKPSTRAPRVYKKRF